MNAEVLLMEGKVLEGREYLGLTIFWCRLG